MLDAGHCDPEALSEDDEAEEGEAECSGEIAGFCPLPLREGSIFGTLQLCGLPAAYDQGDMEHAIS